MIKRPAALALCLLLVAGCNRQTDESKAKAQGGEILPGSISDDMIDLDTSTASPPLAPAKAAAGKKVTTPEAAAASEAADGTEASAMPASPAPVKAAPAGSVQPE